MTLREVEQDLVEAKQAVENAVARLKVMEDRAAAIMAEAAGSPDASTAAFGKLATERGALSLALPGAQTAVEAAKTRLAEVEQAHAAAELERDRLDLEAHSRSLREDETSLEAFVHEVKSQALALLAAHGKHLEEAKALERSLNFREHPNDYLEVRISTAYWRAIGLAERDCEGLLAEVESVVEAGNRARRLAEKPLPPDPEAAMRKRQNDAALEAYTLAEQEKEREAERRRQRGTRSASEISNFEAATRSAIDAKVQRDNPQATHRGDYRPTTG
jgi:hypothetical protein